MVLFSLTVRENPIRDSSEKNSRYRLNRGGDREVNAAMFRIVAVRLGHDLWTEAYMLHHATEGMSKCEIIRCLNLYVAREVFSVIHSTGVSPLCILTSTRSNMQSKPEFEGQVRNPPSKWSE